MTDQPIPETPTEPVLVLVRPQMGENIGAAARAMLNFGLTRMRVVAPRDGWPNPKAVAMASGAARVLDRAGRFDTLPEALRDCHYTFATTARNRELTKPVLTPEEAMAQVHALTAQGKRVGLLFGPERTGLENEDVARADALITVPVNPAFPSINLAQCVLLLAYEWRRQGEAAAAAPTPQTAPDYATGLEIEKFGDHIEEVLDTAGFFFPPAKAPNMKTNVRNMWGRLPLTRADVQILHGMLRQIVRWKGSDAP